MIKNLLLSITITFCNISFIQAQQSIPSKDWVKKYIDSYFSADFDELKADYWDNDLIFLEATTDKEYKGLKEVLSYLEPTFAYLKEGSYEVKDIFYSGNSFIVINGKGKFSFKAKEALGINQEGYISFDIPMTMILKIKNNKVIYQADYTDSIEFVKQMRAQIKK